MMIRKYGNVRLTRRHFAGLALACAPGVPARAAGLAPEPPARVALGGFDAVSYFVPGADGPEPGLAILELGWGGRTWRFAHAANRAAFTRDPAVYAPRLRGFDPLGVVAGRFVGADPLIFLLAPGPDGPRLYLFRTRENRSAFTADAGLAAQAEARWPALYHSPDADPAD